MHRSNTEHRWWPLRHLGYRLDRQGVQDGVGPSWRRSWPTLTPGFGWPGLPVAAPLRLELHPPYGVLPQLRLIALSQGDNVGPLVIQAVPDDLSESGMTIDVTTRTRIPPHRDYCSILTNRIGLWGHANPDSNYESLSSCQLGGHSSPEVGHREDGVG